MGKSITPTIEGGLLVAITVILGSVTFYIPLIGMFVEFFFAVPLAVLTTRQGTGKGLTALFVSFFLLAMLTGPISAIRLALGSGACGVALGYCVRKNFSAVRIFFTVLVVASAAQIFLLGSLIAIMDVNVIDTQIEMVRESFAKSAEMYESLGVDKAHISESTTQIESAIKVISFLIPTFIMLYALLNAVMIWLMAHWIFPKLQLKIPTLPPFAEWRFPVMFTYIAIIGGLGLYWGVTRGWTEIQEISLNLMVISMIIGLIQGLALLSAVFDHYKISKIVQCLLYVIFVLNLFFLQLVAITGLIDMIFDYRKKFFDGR